MIRFSVRFNNDISIAQFVRAASIAEENGLDQVWVSNDLFWRSAQVLIAAATPVTSRIAFGAGVFNPVSMHVSEIAMAAIALQELSIGRFLLGIGAGADRFLTWAGLPRESPVTRTRKALLELRSLLAGQPVPGWPREGRLAIEGIDVPIYVGAMGPRMLELAGELADGALPLLLPPEHYAAAIQRIAVGARRAGRDIGDLDIAACVWCSVSNDPAAARHAMASKIAYYGPSFHTSLLAQESLTAQDFAPIEQAMSDYGIESAASLVTPQMLRLGIVGTADEVIARCERLVSSGATHVSFGPPLGPDVERAIRILGREVIPALRAKGGKTKGTA